MKKRTSVAAILALVVIFAVGMLAVGCGDDDTPETTAAPTETTEAATSTTEAAVEEPGEDEGGEPEELKIGAAVSLTGLFSASETLVWEGEQIFEKWINDKGGIDVGGQKYTIKMVPEDCQSSPEGSSTAATKLIDAGCDFIVGPIVPFTVIASGTVTEPAEVIRVILYNCHTPDEYGPDTPFTFIANDVTTDFIQPDLNYLKDNYPDVKKLTVLTPDDGAPPIFMPMVKEMMVNSGFELLDYFEYDMGAPDFTPYVTQALATNPDAMFFINGWPIFMGNMLKIARQQGFEGPIFGSHEDPYDIAEIAGPEASDEFYTHNIQMDSPKMTPLIKEVLAMGEEMFGKASPTHIWSFNAAYCLVQAIEAAGTLDTKVVAETWENLPSIDTVYGPGVMGGLQSYGIKHNVSYATPFSMLKDGKVEFIDFLPVELP